MGEITGIGWTDATWNPWYGCSKVSPGCAHCYMFRDMKRYGSDPEVVTRSKTKFDEPRKWKTPRRVFTCSWSDWFHEGADAWRAEAWAIVRDTPHLTYQILTKRPERIADHLPPDWGEGYPNVWLGTSVENQRFAFRADILAMHLDRQREKFFMLRNRGGANLEELRHLLRLVRAIPLKLRSDFSNVQREIHR